eukprot:6344633-Alexandrium_andersonii.AAC.1
MLPCVRPRPRQLAGARRELHQQFMDLGTWGRQAGAWAQAAHEDTSCGGSYVFEMREARA